MKRVDGTTAPGNVAQIFQQARVLYNSSDLASASALCDEVLKLASDHFGAWHLKGVIAYQHQQLPNAEQFVRQALAIDPKHPEALNNLGAILLGQGKWAEAVSSFDKVLLVQPTSALALANRGMALLKVMKFEEALGSFDKALAIASDADAFYGRGNALLKLGRAADALASFGRALAMRPGFTEAMTNRAVALFDLLQHEEAIQACEQSLAIKPNQAEALSIRGSALLELGRINEAIESLNAALAIRADHPAAHLSLGFCKLMAGDFEQGWEEYEWRGLTASSTTSSVNEYARPRLPDADGLRSKTVLLQAEQGLGDTIQFCRYVPMLAEKGAHVVLQVQPPLKSLLSRLAGVGAVIAQGEPIPRYDYCFPLLSLPLNFKTNLSTIPAPIPYLRASSEHLAVWRSKLENMPRPLIGLVWSGNPAHRNDRNRSIPLEQLARLLHVNGTFISLQKDCRAAEAEWLHSHSSLRHFGDELLSFEDTAALASLMDVIVSVDTSTAHLSGALGKRLFVLLPMLGADWRWLQRRTDSPWYPTAHLVRQTTRGDWSEAVGYVVDALRGEGVLPK